MINNIKSLTYSLMLSALIPGCSSKVEKIESQKPNTSITQDEPLGYRETITQRHQEFQNPNGSLKNVIEEENRLLNGDNSLSPADAFRAQVEARQKLGASGNRNYNNRIHITIEREKDK